MSKSQVRASYRGGTKVPLGSKLQLNLFHMIMIVTHATNIRREIYSLDHKITIFTIHEFITIMLCQVILH